MSVLLESDTPTDADKIIDTQLATTYDHVQGKTDSRLKAVGSGSVSSRLLAKKNINVRSAVSGSDVTGKISPGQIDPTR